MTAAGESTSPGARELHEVGLLLYGGGLDAGNVGAPLLAVAWRAIPKAERTPDAVRALAEGLRAEGARLGEGVLGRWWGPDDAGAMMLLDRRMIDRLGALGAEGDAAKVEKAAKARWAKGWGAGGPLEPWLVRLPARSTPERPELATLARVRGLDPATGRVEAGAGPDGLTWVWLWNEALRRGRLSPADAAALGQSGAALDERAAPPAIRDAVRALEREIVEAAGESTGEDWTAARWVDLARALWPKVKAEIDRKRSKPAATIRPVQIDVLASVTARQGRLPGIDSGPLTLTGHNGKRIGSVAMTSPQIEAIIREEGLDAFRTLTAQRLVKYLILAGHDQVFAGGVDPRTIVWVGGFEVMAEAIGARSNKAPNEIRNLLLLGAEVHIDTPFVEAKGLWTWTHEKPVGRQRSTVRVTLSDALLPDYGERAELAGKDRSRREARRLVPELRTGPPVSMVDPSSQGGVYAAHRAVLVRAVDEAPRIAAGDGFALDLATLGETLRRFGGPALERKAERVREGWLSGDADAPPLLAAVDAGRDRYTLSDAHEVERRFIEEGGKRRTQGAVQGKAGKGAKENARARFPNRIP